MCYRFVKLSGLVKNTEKFGFIEHKNFLNFFFGFCKNSRLNNFVKKLRSSSTSNLLLSFN